MPYCPKCGKEVTEEFNICPNCGNVLRSISPTSHVSIGTKNPGVGAVLSLLIAGLGQIYAGRIGRGLLIMFIAIPLTIIVAFLFFWLILPLFLPLAIWIWNIFDAYNICKKYNTLLTETEKSPW